MHQGAQAKVKREAPTQSARHSLWPQGPETWVFFATEKEGSCCNGSQYGAACVLELILSLHS